MRTLSKSLLGIFLLAFTAGSWAACPEGTKGNYKGECVPVAGESKESTAPDRNWDQLPIGRVLENPGNCKATDEGISFKEYANWKKENRPTDSKTGEKKTHCYNPDTNTLTKSRICQKKYRVTLEEGEALVKQGN